MSTQTHKHKTNQSSSASNHSIKYREIFRSNYLLQCSSTWNAEKFYTGDVVRSSGELELWLWACGELDVTFIDRRPFTLVFHQPDGGAGSFTFPFIVHLRDRRRLAFAVADDAFAESRDCEAILRDMAHLLPDSVADGIALLTERSLPPAACLPASARNAVGRS